jgi:hypothetical protein
MALISREIGKNYPVAVEILADPKAGMATLTTLLTKTLSASAKRTALSGLRIRVLLF